MFSTLSITEDLPLLENHPLANISSALHLGGGDIKHFYHLGNELGQGSYGIVKVSQRNCAATNQMYLQQQSRSKNAISQLSYAIKQVLIPEIDSNFIDSHEQEQELLELQMINREYESLTQLDHPLICELLEVFID